MLEKWIKTAKTVSYLKFLYNFAEDFPRELKFENIVELNQCNRIG